MSIQPGKLIALSSPVMRSGKSEVANHLVTHHGFRLVKFAGPLKSMVGALLADLDYPASVVTDLLEGPLKEMPLRGLDYSPRQLMQTLGTEWGRETLDENFWVRLAALKIAQYQSFGFPVVVDDLRFPNEMTAVETLGGECYRVLRLGAPRYEGHPSEGALQDHMMRTIHNDGTLAQLYAKADQIAGAK